MYKFSLVWKLHCCCECKLPLSNVRKPAFCWFKLRGPRQMCNAIPQLLIFITKTDEHTAAAP